MGRSLTLHTYWDSYGDESAGNATAVFRFIKGDHELVRVLTREHLSALGSTERHISYVLAQMCEENLLRGSDPPMVSGEDDLYNLTVMIVRAAKFIMADMTSYQYTRRRLVQGISNIKMTLECSKATDFNLRMVCPIYG